MEQVLTLSAAEPETASRRASALVSAGRVLTTLCVTFLLFDAIGKLIPLDVVVEGTRRFGYELTVIRPLGIILAVSTLLHVIPRTQLLGAVLLTAYLGGATATHVQSGTPFWFPVVMGAIIWVAYYLRSPQLRVFLQSPGRSARAV